MAMLGSLSRRVPTFRFQWPCPVVTCWPPASCYTCCAGRSRALERSWWLSLTDEMLWGWFNHHIYLGLFKVIFCFPMENPWKSGESIKWICSIFLGPLKQIQGCRLAFDLGKSDIKTVAVKDGEAVNGGPGPVQLVQLWGDRSRMIQGLFHGYPMAYSMCKLGVMGGIRSFFQSVSRMIFNCSSNVNWI